MPDKQRNKPRKGRHGKSNNGKSQDGHCAKEQDEVQFQEPGVRVNREQAPQMRYNE